MIEQELSRSEPLSRREFLKVAGLFLSSLGLPPPRFLIESTGIEKPSLKEEQINFLASYEISWGDKSDKKRNVMMTYDDIGNPYKINTILDAYEHFGANATFFVNGAQFERYPDTVRRIVEDGHLLGCHGDQHGYKRNGWIVTFAGLSGEEIDKDIKTFLEKADKVIPGYSFKYLRFPYGSRNERALQAVARWGMQSVMWGLSSGGMNKDATIKRVLEGVKNGIIVLSHISRYGDVHGAETIVESLVNLGYSLVTVEEGLAPQNRRELNEAFMPSAMIRRKFRQR